jgi:hypothetical protein
VLQTPTTTTFQPAKPPKAANATQKLQGQPTNNLTVLKKRKQAPPAQQTSTGTDMPGPQAAKKRSKKRRR